MKEVAIMRRLPRQIRGLEAWLQRQARRIGECQGSRIAVSSAMLSLPEPEAGIHSDPAVQTLTVAELRQLWRQRGLKGCSTSRRQELLDRLLSPAAPTKEPPIQSSKPGLAAMVLLLKRLRVPGLAEPAGWQEGDAGLNCALAWGIRQAVGFIQPLHPAVDAGNATSLIVLAYLVRNAGQIMVSLSPLRPTKTAGFPVRTDGTLPELTNAGRTTWEPDQLIESKHQTCLSNLTRGMDS
ncbi:MAG: hypothetical protein NTV57_13030 [Cyanobacteria bacterium]|nr:hypothetical protein [Cyanobacteriota bacterium]